MAGDRRGREETPVAAHLHLHRGIGWGLYGTVTVATLLVGVLAVVANLRDGRLVTAAVIAAGSLAVGGVLAVVTHAMVWPAITATAVGISGRMPRGTVEVGWSDVTIDVDDDREAGTLRLEVGDRSLSVNARAWVGFADFVLLVSTHPQAAARLTPTARAEVRRLLGLGP